MQETLPPRDLEAFLAAHPDWSIVTTPRPGLEPGTRTELERVFTFATFDEALAFMRAAAPFINARDHHPRWENAHRRLTVRLSTWDAGQTVSRLDLDLARHLDGLHAAWST